MSYFPASRRIAHFLEADLSPPLGKPGGPCYVVQRIDQQVQNPKLRDTLIDEVETGEDLSNAEASKVYGLDKERGVGAIENLVITSHAQYRMDLRGVTVEDVRSTLQSFLQQLEEWRKRGNPAFERMRDTMRSGEKVEWVGKNKLKVVFSMRGTSANLVTTFWKGVPDPVAPRGGCPLPKRASRVVARYLASVTRDRVICTLRGTA